MAGLLSPGRECSLTELASKTGASLSSAQREMARAQDAGVVSSRRLGNTRLVTAADSTLTGPLTEFLLRSFGPRQVIAEELAGLAGIEKGFLFGSWAARYAGQAGPAPADIDVLVIGQPDATTWTKPHSGPDPGSQATSPAGTSSATTRCDRRPAIPTRSGFGRLRLEQRPPSGRRSGRLPCCRLVGEFAVFAEVEAGFLFPWAHP